MSQVQAQTSHQPGARAQLAAALSTDEFQCLEALLTSTGRTFNDVSVAGDTWTVSAGGGQRSFPRGKGRGRKHQQQRLDWRRILFDLDGWSYCHVPHLTSHRYFARGWRAGFGTGSR